MISRLPKKITRTDIIAKAAGKIVLINGDKQKVTELKKSQRIEINW